MARANPSNREMSYLWLSGFNSPERPVLFDTYSGWMRLLCSLIGRKQMTTFGLLKQADLSLEVVILLFAGMAMLILGILLFPVYAGILSYYENGLFGLLLVVFALQIISMGKTPFGDTQRSRTVILFGVIIAATGMVTCFIPDIFGNLPRILLVIFFGAGGLVLFLEMLFAQNKYRLWRTCGGIFNHLVLGCSAVYTFQILVAVLVFDPDLLRGPQVASAALLYGLALVYLAWVLQKVTWRHPPTKQKVPSDRGLSMDNASLLVMGVFMLLLGLLLIPVSLGFLPFSGSAQIGLLMVMFAIQMLALGNTPIGPFPRSWLIILLGFVFGALGVVACVIPGILVAPLTLLVGVLNMAGGVSATVKVIVPFLKGRKAAEPVPAILLKINSALLVMNILTILFGATMLFSGLISGLIIGMVLAANGCVLLYLVCQLVSLEKMQ
jgi:MFS family permease